MHCKNCGFKLEENSKYCTNCGMKNIKKDIEKQPQEESNSKKTMTLLIAFSSIVIILLGGIYVKVGRNKGEEEYKNLSKVEVAQDEDIIEEDFEVDTSEGIYELETVKDTVKKYNSKNTDKTTSDKNTTNYSNKVESPAFKLNSVRVEKAQVNKGESIKLNLDTGGENTRFFKIAYINEYGNVDEYIFDTYENKNLDYNPKTQKYEFYIDTNNINVGNLKAEFIAIQEGEGVPLETEYEDLLAIVDGEDGADLSYLDVSILGNNPKSEVKVWQGTYEAGEYDRSVKISFLEDDRVIFEFGPTEKTTHVPYGKYAMKVNSYDESSGELFLEGYEWIEKPDTAWEFAKFKGIIDSNQFKGEVYNTSKNHYLGTFSLERLK